ncbi:MAG: LysM peptidoglycan-binding domain-containing protein [Sedimentisphaerales bacterium]|nr:LysM peptidoglycan-binding domain-containing protein [Sedimentisphaerales bacterium]
MTSDAKIGLLLGLVFIFIIAFIINGLPKLHGQTDSNELTMNMVRNDPPGVGWERRADEVLNPPDAVTQGLAQIPRPSFDPAGTFAQDTGDIRYEIPIPQYDTIVKDVLARQDLLGPVNSAGNIGIVSPADIVSKSNTVLKTGPTVSISNSVPKPVTPAFVKPASTKTYVVAGGDSLASIAKKFYGLEQGNIRANVAGIFEANRNLLKSPDEIMVGQKLVIPALPNTLLDKPATGSLMTPELFEKVKSIGQKNITPATTLKTQERLYQVKEGDSLWSIAADQLGNGVRYAEISKLNADILSSEDSISIGMKLKIPTK